MSKMTSMQAGARMTSHKKGRPLSASSKHSTHDTMPPSRALSVASKMNGSMASMADSMASSVECPFKPFTHDSLKKILEREEEEKRKKKEKEGKTQDEAILVDGELKFEDEEDKPELDRDPALAEGASLPESMGDFPKNLRGKPIEEIDPYLKQKTFVVIAKGFKSYNISRFSATKGFFLLSAWNPFRRFALYLATHQLFEVIILLTILSNCVLLGINDLPEEPEYVFLGLYVIEMVIKCAARGFILAPYTYLRDPWNWLDFVIVMIGILTTIFTIIGQQELLANISGLRTFRVLRALKTVSIVPGLKTIVAAIFKSLKMLAEVLLLMFFCMMVFSLFALQVYMGILHNKCVMNAPYPMPNNTDANTTYDKYWYDWLNNQDNWYEYEEEYLLCGNKTTAVHCPEGYSCLPDAGGNPNNGYTSFDDFPWAMLTMFQLITLDFWEDTYNKIISADGKWNMIFFMIIVLFGSFYLMNLMLAVVTMSYEEEANNSKELEKAEKLKQKANKKVKKKKNLGTSMLNLDPTKLNMSALHPERTNETKYQANEGSKISMKENSSSKISLRHGGSKISLKHEQNGDIRKSRASIRDHKEDIHSNRQSTKSNQTDNDPQNEDASSIGHDNQAFENEKVLMKMSSQDTMATTETLVEELDPVSLQKDVDASAKTVDKPTEVRKEDAGGKSSETKTQISNIAVETKDTTGSLNSTSMPTSPDPANGVVMKGDIWLDKSDSESSDEEELSDRNCLCCKRRSTPVTYARWRKTQDFLYKIVSDSVFEGFVTVCIVLNTICMGIEHHGMSTELSTALENLNYLFTTIFTAECVLKIWALSREYFKNGWNVFDFVIVIFSLLELILVSVVNLPGISALRTFRLMRVFKLAQSWSTMKLLLSIILSTLSSIGNLTFILFIIIYMFAVMGMQLFRKEYTPDKFADGEVPRWNFSNFLHAMAMIFRVLCGEWIEPLWDCMIAAGPTCLLVFLPALFLGNFMVLNLFLALLLNSFSSDSLKSANENVKQKKKGSRLIKAITLALRWKKVAKKKKVPTATLR